MAVEFSTLVVMERMDDCFFKSVKMVLFISGCIRVRNIIRFNERVTCGQTSQLEVCQAEGPASLQVLCGWILVEIHSHLLRVSDLKKSPIHKSVPERREQLCLTVSCKRSGVNCKPWWRVLGIFPVNSKPYTQFTGPRPTAAQYKPKSQSF